MQRSWTLSSVGSNICQVLKMVGDFLNIQFPRFLTIRTPQVMLTLLPNVGVSLIEIWDCVQNVHHDFIPIRAFIKLSSWILYYWTYKGFSWSLAWKTLSQVSNIYFSALVCFWRHFIIVAMSNPVPASDLARGLQDMDSKCVYFDRILTCYSKLTIWYDKYSC